jgi:hypothetical protein
MNHSDKAKLTLSMMDSTEAGWVHPDIEWKFEKRKVLVEVPCRHCDGSKKSWEIDGQWLCGEYSVTETYKRENGIKEPGYIYIPSNVLKAWLDGLSARLSRCNKCWLKPVYGKRTRWSIKEYQMKDVMVGYIKWLPGTQFKSRFRYSDGFSNTHCELCAKGINQSNRVPVQGFTSDKSPIAMWVGQDLREKDSRDFREISDRPLFSRKLKRGNKMRIIQKKNETKRKVTYAELKEGDLFMFAYGEGLRLKTVTGFVTLSTGVDTSVASPNVLVNRFDGELTFWEMEDEK